MDFFLVIHTKFQCYEIRFDRLLIIDFFFWFYSVIVYVWYWIEFIYSHTHTHTQKLMNPCEIWILGIHCVCVCMFFFSVDNNHFQWLPIWWQQQQQQVFFSGERVCVCVLSMVTTNFFFHSLNIYKSPSIIWCLMRVCVCLSNFFLLLHGQQLA